MPDEKVADDEKRGFSSAWFSTEEVHVFSVEDFKRAVDLVRKNSSYHSTATVHHPKCVTVTTRRVEDCTCAGRFLTIPKQG